MRFKRDVKRLMKADAELGRAVGIIKTKIQHVCEFEIHLEFVPGDGWCFGADVTGFPLYMPMDAVLEVVEKTGLFTEDDWSPIG